MSSTTRPVRSSLCGGGRDRSNGLRLGRIPGHIRKGHVPGHMHRGGERETQIKLHTLGDIHTRRCTQVEGNTHLRICTRDTLHQIMYTWVGT
jgi:hypothetical protein